MPGGAPIGQTHVRIEPAQAAFQVVAPLEMARYETLQEIFLARTHVSHPTS